MLASAIYQFCDGILVNLFLGETAFADLIGIGSSVIISVKLGQNNRKEANGIFTSSVLMILVLDIIIGVLVFFTSEQLIGILGANNDVKELTTMATFIFAFTYLSRWISYASQGLFQAIEKSIPAIIISLSISLIFPLIILGCLYSIDLVGIWLNVPLSSLLTGILCLIFIFYYFKIEKDLYTKMGLKNIKTSIKIIQ